MNYLKLVLIAILLQCMSSCDNSAGVYKGQDAVVLKFNHAEGKVYEYEMDVNIENEAQGKSMELNMEFDYQLEVIDDSSGYKTVRTTYNRIRMSRILPDSEMNIDTDNIQDTSTGTDPMNMMGKIFYTIKGKGFDLKISPEGKVVEVKGLDKMQEAIIAGMDPDDKRRPYFESGFKSQFNEEKIRQSFEQVFDIFPNKKVRVGDSWDRQMDISSGMMKINTTFKVKEINNNKVILESSSDFNMMGNNGTQTGTYEIDANTGLVAKMETTQQYQEPVKMKMSQKIIGREVENR